MSNKQSADRAARRQKLADEVDTAAEERVLARIRAGEIPGYQSNRQALMDLVERARAAVQANGKQFGECTKEDCLELGAFMTHLAKQEDRRHELELRFIEGDQDAGAELARHIISDAPLPGRIEDGASPALIASFEAWRVNRKRTRKPSRKSA